MSCDEKPMLRPGKGACQVSYVHCLVNTNLRQAGSPGATLDPITKTTAGGMAENPQVQLMRPLDNLITELNDVLGPWGASSRLVPDLPRFVQGIPETVPEEDLEYLASKGVFTLPGLILRQELLKAFVESVYPFLPVLDLESFLHCVISGDGVDQVSLLNQEQRCA
ncbi:hypothetical protein BDW59DRAFT_167976 [Aspergillus cavernicola]|uniref:Uncharacterized protein n=1 Tax=Aspergillus cavernicola TaxID=176166 RepID=A0ABR4H865_9EURO